MGKGKFKVGDKVLVEATIKDKWGMNWDIEIDKATVMTYGGEIIIAIDGQSLRKRSVKEEGK